MAIMFVSLMRAVNPVSFTGYPSAVQTAFIRGRPVGSELWLASITTSDAVSAEYARVMICKGCGTTAPAFT